MKTHIAVLLTIAAILAGGCRDLRDNELYGVGIVKIYDPASGIVSKGAPPPLIADLESELCIVYEEKIFHFGTAGYAQPTRPIMVYDPAADSWSLRPRPRMDVARFASAPEGIYVLSSISELFLYNPATNIAAPLGRIPRTPDFGIYPVGCTYGNGMFYVAAATPGPGLVVDSYDPAAYKWELRAKQPLSGYGFFPEVDAVVAEGGWYFLLYERSQPDYWNFTNVSLYRYDFATDAMENRAPFPDKFEHCAYAAPRGPDLYFFMQDCPEVSGAAAVVRVYRYDSAGDAWERGTAFSLPGGCLCGVTGDNAAYLLGGHRADHLALVEYDFAAGTADMVAGDLGVNFTRVFEHHDGFRLAWANGKVIILGMGFYEKKRR
ncbi:MAG: hypothetical protein E3J72_05855 [Planctomycetota bacterium]|nr:MAG: hypothetical protein E3J72_05855 [Planctomycetota bacterium]